MADARLYMLYVYAAAVSSSPDTPMDIEMLSMDLGSGDYLGAGLDTVSLLLPGVTNLSDTEKAVKTTTKILENAEKGRAFEKAGLDLLGMTKNTEKIGGRIADVMLKDGKGGISAIVEFKNCKSLSRSEQLTTFINQVGQNFSLVVNGDTKIASTLWKQIEKAGGHIYRMVDGELTKIL